MGNQKQLNLSGLTIIFTLLFIFVLVYFYQYNPSENKGIFLRCPSNFLFGINCPGCGSQRALHHLLHLNLIEALRFNALFVFGFIGMLFIGIRYLFGYKKTIPFKLNKYVFIGLFILVILYGILRNVPIYPFTLLSP